MINYIFRNMKSSNNPIRLLGFLGIMFILLLCTASVCLGLYNYYSTDNFFAFANRNERIENIYPEIPTVDMEEIRIKNSIAVNFATSLMQNRADVYDITHPELWPRLDEWMSKHEPRFCKTLINSPLIGGGVNGWNISMSCILTEDSRKGWHSSGVYLLRITNIVIVDEVIINYDNIVEE